MADEEVKPGDLVITTGGDGIFPKGLPVGNVVEVTRGHGALFLEIRMHPAADLNRLEEVLVITKLQDVAPAGDVAGAQRAVDILAARLPGVPDKPDAAKVSSSQSPVSSNPAPGLAGNSKPETRNLSAPKAPLTPPAKPPKATKPAVAAKPAEERTQ